MGKFDLALSPDFLEWYYGTVERMIHDKEFDAEDISLPSGEEDVITATKVLRELINSNPSFASCLERINLSKDESGANEMNAENKTKSLMKKTTETKTVKKKKNPPIPRKTTEVSGIWDKLNKL